MLGLIIVKVIETTREVEIRIIIIYNRFIIVKIRIIKKI